MPIVNIDSNIVDSISKHKPFASRGYRDVPYYSSHNTVVLENTHSVGSKYYLILVPMDLVVCDFQYSNSPMGLGTVKFGFCTPDSYRTVVDDDLLSKSASLTDANSRKSALDMTSFLLTNDGLPLWKILYPSLRSYGEVPYASLFLFATLTAAINGQGGLKTHLYG